MAEKEIMFMTNEKAVELSEKRCHDGHILTDKVSQVKMRMEQYPQLLKIIIHQLDKIMIMDRLHKSSNLYVMVKFAGIENKTSTFHRKLDVHVHECLTIPVIQKPKNNDIILYVMHHNEDREDEIIGTYKYKYNKLLIRPLKNSWVFIYGAPSGKQKGLAKDINLGIKEGTTYRGSLLLGMQIVSPSKDEELAVECTKAAWNKKDAPKIKQWVLQVHVYQGTDVYDGKGKFQIKMMIRDLKLKTKFAKCKQSVCQWSQFIVLPDSDAKEDTINLRMPQEAKQCPDVFFYVVKKSSGLFAKDHVISYLRFSWSELIEKDASFLPQYYQFKSSDVLHKKTEADNPGSILLGLRAALKQDKHKWKAPEIQENTSLLPVHSLQRRPVRIPFLPGQLRVTVVRAQNVPQMYRHSWIMPYVEIEVNGRTQRTSIQWNTRNPTWNETFTFNGVSGHSSLALQLNHWERFARKTRIGKVIVEHIDTLLQEPAVELDGDNVLNYTKRLYISKKYSKCILTINLQYKKDEDEYKYPGFQENALSVPIHKVSRRTIYKPLEPEELRVTVVRAQNLPAMDRGRNSDPYIALTVNGNTQKTSVQKNTCNPTWHETFTFNQVSIYDSISFELNNWNRFGKRTRIGGVNNIVLNRLLQEAGQQLDVSNEFVYTKQFPVSEKFTNCTVTLSILYNMDQTVKSCEEVKRRNYHTFAGNGQNDYYLLGRKGQQDDNCSCTIL